MRIRQGVLLIGVLLLVLHGCVAVESNVSVFHRLPSKGTGETFAIVPGIESLKHSLEFETMTQPLAQRLESYGLRRAADQETARYLVVVSYWVGNGQTEIRSVPIFGQTGGGTTHHSGTVGGTSYNGTSNTVPTYGIVGTATRSSTVYTRHLTVDLVDYSRFVEGEEIVKLYEGKVVSAGSTGAIAPVVPAMIVALLKDFPGKSGSKRTVIGQLQ